MFNKNRINKNDRVYKNDFDELSKDFQDVEMSMLRNLNNVYKNMELLDKKATDRYTYQFQQFSNYLKEKDTFLLEQIKSIVNHFSNNPDMEDNILKNIKKDKNQDKNPTIDEILDKISKDGFDTLTDIEKSILKNNDKNE